MKILISGGTGFIGRPLVARLVSDGHEVVVLSRDPVSARRGLPPQVGVEATQPAVPVPAPLLETVEAFVHLAAEPLAGRWTGARRARIVESRTSGTQVFADALQCAPRLRTFINASGIGVYGTDGDGPFDERDAPGTGFIAEVTSARERAAERARIDGRRVVHARIGIVLHPEGGFLQQLAKLRRLGLSGQFGSGTQPVSWIHRDDVVSLLATAVSDARWDGPLNVCAPQPTTNRKLTRSVAEIVGGGGVRLPAWLTRLVLGELGTTLLGGQRVTPTRALERGFRFRYPELDGALRALLSLNTQGSSASPTMIPSGPRM